MDRSILEGNPFAVIEGMMIAGHAIGASDGYFYVRAEYPIAVQRLQTAVKQMEECGLLGDNILGTNFSFRVHVRLGAGRSTGKNTPTFTSAMTGACTGMRFSPPILPM